MSDGQILGFGKCYGCGKQFTFDPEKVIGVKIDPVTNRPPDVGPDAKPQPITEEARARMVEAVICADCIEFKINPKRIQQGQAAMPVYR